MITLAGACVVALTLTGTTQRNRSIQVIIMHGIRFIFVQLPLMENAVQCISNVLDCYLLIIAILSICPLLIGLVPESICTIMSVFTLSVTEVK